MADAELLKLSYELKRKSDEDLAAFRADKIDTSMYAILADKEFERRARIKQHELDRQLIAEQVRWMKFTAILGAVTTIIGTILGALLAIWLQKDPQAKQGGVEQRPTQQQTGRESS